MEKINNQVFKKWLFFRSVRRVMLLVSITVLFIGFAGYILYSSYNADYEVSLLDGLSVSQDHPDQMNNQIADMTRGYPIEVMLPYILEKDPKVSAFLISIAKKESNWGKRAPVLDGQDCYNYWGFRASRDRMGTGGHTCFDTPKDAVDSVAARIEDLVNKQVDTPKEMVVWKCGSSCKTHSNTSVQKWISDVGLYFQKIYE